MSKDELRSKLKYTYIDYGMALVVSGHQLDKYLDEAMALIATDKRNSEALLKSDLAWCLGKLRGLGHPAEHLEDKYQLHPTEPINKEKS